MRIGWMIVLASGCTAVTLEGVVVQSPGSELPAGGVDVTLRDQNFEVVDSLTVGADGKFALTTPRSGYVFVVVEGEGFVPVSHPGESGTGGTFEVPLGDVFALPTSTAEAWRALFTGCPGADGDAPMIVGELHVPLFSDTYPEGPPWPNLFARRSVLEDPETDRQEACYFGAEGAPDPAALATDPSGRFGMFGVPSGPGLMSVGQHTTAGTLVAQFPVWVPDGGAVMLLPALVPM